MDTDNDWIAYKIGSEDDLVITWAGANNSECLFASSITVNGNSVLPGWITDTPVQVQKQSYTTYLYSATSDGSTRFSTSD